MKNVLFVTGGNRGLGLQIVDLFASKGYDIIVSTRQPYEAFEQHCRSLESQYAILIHHIYMDLSEQESIDEGLRQFALLGITPTVLVNNASKPYDRVAMMSKMDDIKDCFQVNYFAAVQISQKVAKTMLRTGGSIINISSVSSLTKQTAGTGYSASKAALNVFTTSLAQELASFRIRVNAVAPGGMQTEMFDATNEKNKQALTDSTALKRVADPKEVASVVYFLASEESSYINGQIIRVDGGLQY